MARMFLLTAMLAASTAAAQENIPATTVQLPTFSFFSVATTVSVPDRGGVYLGGVSRAREGSVSRGVPLLGGPLFRNRGIGREMSTSGLSAHVRIIDLHEMDEAVLAAAREGRGGSMMSGGAGFAASPELPLAMWLTQHMGRRAARRPERSYLLDAPQFDAPQQDSPPQLAAVEPAQHSGGPLDDYLQRADRAVDAKNFAQAKLLYAKAAEFATGEQREELLLRARLSGLGAP